jgi:hypothetical protein
MHSQLSCELVGQGQGSVLCRSHARVTQHLQCSMSHCMMCVAETSYPIASVHCCQTLSRHCVVSFVVCRSRSQTLASALRQAAGQYSQRWATGRIGVTAGSPAGRRRWGVAQKADDAVQLNCAAVAPLRGRAMRCWSSHVCVLP